MAAPLLGALRPCVHRFRLGAFEVTTILDGAQVRSGVSPGWLGGFVRALRR